MEVFIAYTPQTNMAHLEKALEAWEAAGLEPVAIQCKAKKFEIIRRVTAENMSRASYVLADIDCEPMERDFGDLAEKLLDKHATAGLLGAWRIGQQARELPNGVVVCRKGVVERWPTPVTAFYIQEHVKAIELAGMTTLLCQQIHYRRANTSLPC